jgi:RNA polymerase sigma factor (sigma-70 family)
MAVLEAEDVRLPLLGRTAESELERLYAKHAGEVRRYVQMVLRNRNDAEDVVQQTFLKALRALQQGVRPEKPRPWLVAIAHNECRMLFRQAARRPVEVELDTAGELAAGANDSVSAEAISEALGQLAPNQRAALVMRELDDRSYAEIAELLGVSESAVETLLFRARRALREQLESAGGCEDAQALLAAGSLDEVGRKRVRAHLRTCQACATLDRRRRGKLAAAGRKLAGLFPTPSWLSSLLGGGGAKAVVAIATAAVAATGAVEVAKPDSSQQHAKAAMVVVHHDAIHPSAAPAIASALAQLAPTKPTAAARTAVAGHGRLVARPAAPHAAAARGVPAPAVDDHLLPVDEPAAAPQPDAAPQPYAATPAARAAQPAAQAPAREAAPVVAKAPEPLPATTTSALPSVPLPTVGPPPVPSLPEPPSTSQLPPVPPAPAPAPPVPPVPPVQPPAIPGVQAPSPPSLTKP